MSSLTVVVAHQLTRLYFSECFFVAVAAKVEKGQGLAQVDGRCPAASDADFPSDAGFSFSRSFFSQFFSFGFRGLFAVVADPQAAAHTHTHTQTHRHFLVGDVIHGGQRAIVTTSAVPATTTTTTTSGCEFAPKKIDRPVRARWRWWGRGGRG